MIQPLGPARLPHAHRLAARCAAVVAIVLFAPGFASGQTTEPAADAGATTAPVAAEDTLPDVAQLKRLVPEHEVWVDKERGRVVVGGRIALTHGPLELFACLKNTKEHESIVAAETQAYVVHAALLGVGAEAGQPVQFRPEFRPASGTEVQVTVYWKDPAGNVRHVDARQWVRHIETQQPLEQPWVFAGSGFWVDPATGQRHYIAEEGDFICVSNFPSAMLDLPIESSQQAGQLMFEAFVERIPPRDTKVWLVLTPQKKQPAEAPPPTDQTEGEK